MMVIHFKDFEESADAYPALIQGVGTLLRIQADSLGEKEEAILVLMYEACTKVLEEEDPSSVNVLLGATP